MAMAHQLYLKENLIKTSNKSTWGYYTNCARYDFSLLKTNN